MNKHELKIFLREYNEHLVMDLHYGDSDLLDIPDYELDEFINNFTLKTT